MKAIYYYDSPIGQIGIQETDGAVTWIGMKAQAPEEGAIWEETPLIRDAAEQLKEYFSGKRKTFSLPLNPKGTEFQKKVWDALLQIPFGQTRTYGEIARQIGNPKACRAVGMANHVNPIMIVIPCHRVIGAKGKLTGYAGALPMKEKLLFEIEKISVH